MNEKRDTRLLDPEIRRVFEEELLFGEVTETLAALIDSVGVSQREVAERLAVSEGRMSQVISGGENLTLRSLAALGWALGIRFELDPIPLNSREREGTPAANDAPPPAWLTRMQKRPVVTYRKVSMPSKQMERPHLRLVSQDEADLAA